MVGDSVGNRGEKAGQLKQTREVSGSIILELRPSCRHLQAWYSTGSRIPYQGDRVSIGSCEVVSRLVAALVAIGQAEGQAPPGGTPLGQASAIRGTPYPSPPMRSPCPTLSAHVCTRLRMMGYAFFFRDSPTPQNPPCSLSLNSRDSSCPISLHQTVRNVLSRDSSVRNCAIVSEIARLFLLHRLDICLRIEQRAPVWSPLHR